MTIRPNDYCVAYLPSGAVLLALYQGEIFRPFSMFGPQLRFSVIGLDEQMYEATAIAPKPRNVEVMADRWHHNFTTGQQPNPKGAA